MVEKTLIHLLLYIRNPPADLPLRLQVGALLIGRAVVTLVSGVASIDQVQSAFNVALGSAVTSHNSLSGLQGGILAECFPCLLQS
jgi:hypothetical protein